MLTTDQHNHKEIQKFDDLSHQWWDTDGVFKTLHAINPARVCFIESNINVNNKRIVDIGCGGGILSESLAKLKAQVTGIDMSYNAIEIAKLHLFDSDLDIDYQRISIQEFEKSNYASFDILTCFEMLEHVANPIEIISSCFNLLKPGGVAFFSTINKSLSGYLGAVLASEYVLKILPRGTHDYNYFIKPSVLSQFLRDVGFVVNKIAGISYNPLLNTSKLTHNVDINYVVMAYKSVC